MRIEKMWMLKLYSCIGELLFLLTYIFWLYHIIDVPYGINFNLKLSELCYEKLLLGN